MSVYFTFRYWHYFALAVFSILFAMASGNIEASEVVLIPTDVDTSEMVEMKRTIELWPVDEKGRRHRDDDRTTLLMPHTHVKSAKTQYRTNLPPGRYAWRAALPPICPDRGYIYVGSGEFDVLHNDSKVHIIVTKKFSSIVTLRVVGKSSDEPLVQVKVSPRISSTGHRDLGNSIATDMRGEVSFRLFEDSSYDFEVWAPSDSQARGDIQGGRFITKEIAVPANAEDKILLEVPEAVLMLSVTISDADREHFEDAENFPSEVTVMSVEERIAHPALWNNEKKAYCLWDVAPGNYEIIVPDLVRQRLGVEVEKVSVSLRAGEVAKVVLGNNSEAQSDSISGR